MTRGVPQTTLAKMWQRTARTDDHWLWLGPSSKQGYGQVSVRQPCGHYEPRLAHRQMYEEILGPIPDGLYLDHMCCNKMCVRPSHLDPCTPGDNVRRYYESRRHVTPGR